MDPGCLMQSDRDVTRNSYGRKCVFAKQRHLANGITGKLGNSVGIAPRLFLRKLVGELLDKVAGTYFRNTAGVAPAVDNDAQVYQAKLEDSNVNPAEGAVRLVSIMRQFEALQKALHIMGEMSSAEVAKVS